MFHRINLLLHNSEPQKKMLPLSDNKGIEIYGKKSITYFLFHYE